MEGFQNIENSGTHYLFPSTIYVSRKPIFIQTILGSCVAVCLFDMRNKIGGMNHYMVPLWNGVGLASPKFGNIAIELLIENMISHGSKKKDLIAKVFGGANQYNHQNDIINVGERNIQIMRTMLEEQRIHIVSESVGGTTGRKIMFETNTGQVMMKYILKQSE